MKRFQPKGDRRLGKQDRRQLHVLYEDDAVVVLNKRAKLLAVPTDDSDTPSALGFCSSQKPGQIEKYSCNSLSDTPRCGNISRQFVVISALKKGLSFATFGKKEGFKR